MSDNLRQRVGAAGAKKPASSGANATSGDNNAEKAR